MHARWLVVSFVIVASASPGARAQSASAQAESLFDGGRALMQAGKLAEACAAFEQSQKLDPRPTTLLNLADCREKSGQLATARGLFAEAEHVARAAGNDKLVGVALNHVRKLEPRLSRLTIAVPADHAVPGLELVRGTDKLATASWNRPVFVDGGSYTVTARAPGRTAWTVTKVIKAEGDAQTIEIPKLVDPNAAVAVATPPPVKPPPAPVPPPPSKPAVVAAPPSKPAADNPHAPPPEVSPPAVAATEPSDPGARIERDRPPVPSTPERSQPSYTPAIVVGAGALALGAVAGLAVLWGDHTYADAQSLHARAMNETGPTQTSDDNHAQSLRTDAITHSHQADAFGISAGVFAAVAVYLGARTYYKRRAESVAVTPVAGPQLTGLAVVGHW